MKWIFILFLFAFTPVLMGWIRQNPKHAPKLGILIGALPFFLAPLHLYVAPISWPAWQGTVKGMEVSLLDAIAVAIVATIPRTTIPKLAKIGLAIIFFALAISTLVAPIWMASMFYVWQLMRTALLAVAVARLVAISPSAAIYAIMGMGAGLLFEAITAGMSFAQGDLQAGGSIGHQNTLGLASYFVAFPAAALFLAGKHVKLAIAILLCEFFVVFVGGSRATVGLVGIGLVLVTMLSIRFRRTGRKAALAGGLMVLGLLSIPVMIAAVDRRSDVAKISSNEEREQFEHAAQMIIADNPLGVGANRYVVVANLGGYSDRAGVTPGTAQRAAPVHNSYLLIVAEMSVIALLGYITLLFAIVRSGFSAMKIGPPGTEGEIVAGLTTAILIASMHAYFEWTAMTYPIHYLFAIDAGLIFGIASRFMALRRQANRHKFPMAAPDAVPLST